MAGVPAGRHPDPGLRAPLHVRAGPRQRAASPATQRPLKILITGATGFVGRALVLRLRREGHDVLAWVRDPSRARDRLGDDVELVPAGDEQALRAAVGRCDAVVNLAGEPLFGARWSDERRQVLRESRIGLTRRIVEAMAQVPHRPGVLVSASAVGYYGDRGDERLTEQSPPGDDFLARLCRDWEAEAERASSLGVRTVRVRIGIVLGRGGGALARMLPPFLAGMGGPMGSGRQFGPWIHLHDLVALLAAALVDNRYSGAVMAAAPEGLPQREFARTLGSLLGRPAFVPAPALALKLALGDAAQVLLASQRVAPERLAGLAFAFEFPKLREALADLVAAEGPSFERLGPSSPAPIDGGGEYLARRPATHLLRDRVVLDAPLQEVFDFFSRPGNLGLLTPPSMAFRIEGAAGPMVAGSTIDYRLRVGAVPIRWRSRIALVSPEKYFVDAQERGPYRSWWHEHHFSADGGGTVMEDRVFYALPLGPIGRGANVVFVKRALRDIFAYRRDAIRLRFGLR